MPRYFNTTGPCDPVRHYLLPPTARLPNLKPYLEAFDTVIGTTIPGDEIDSSTVIVRVTGN